MTSHVSPVCSLKRTMLNPLMLMRFFGALLMMLVLVNPAFARTALPGTGVTPNEGIHPYKHSSYYEVQEGSRLADQGYYDKAIPHFWKAVEQNPASVMAQYNLAYSLLQSAEEEPDPVRKKAKTDQAEWAFLRVRDLNPELTLTYYKLGKIALAREDYKTAAEYYESGVQSVPDNAALWFNLAATYEKRNLTMKAERAYIKAIGANPKFVYAHNNLGLLYEQSQRLPEAEAVYRNALAQVPEYNYARLNLGSLLQGQGRLEEAQQLYQEAISYEPENAWAHLYLGNTYYRKGEYQKALDSYQVARKLNPEYATTYYLMSLVYQKLNRNDEALASGMQYINLAPGGAFSQEANELVLTLQQAIKRAVNLEKP